MTAPQSNIDTMLAAARQGLDRVAPGELDGELEAGAIIVDIRPQADRAAEGAMQDALVIERIHLEWRLDPTSPDRLDVAGPDTRVIVMCNDGYASSLAAHALRQLGVTRATDLAGGYRAWHNSHGPTPIPGPESTDLD